MTTIRYLEVSGSDYTLTPFRVPKEQRPLLHRCQKLKSHIKRNFYRYLIEIFVRFYAQGLSLYAAYFSPFQIKEPHVAV